MPVKACCCHFLYCCTAALLFCVKSAVKPQPTNQPSVNLIFVLVVFVLLANKSYADDQLTILSFLTAWRYASAVYAMSLCLCLCICLYLCVYHTLVFCQNG